MGVVGGRFDDVGVERALGQEVDLAEPARLGLEDLDEGAADAPPLLLGVDDPGQGGEEAIVGVDVHQPDVALPGHDIDHPVTFIAAQQPVVDEDAGELIPHSPVHQGGRHRGVDAPGESADHPSGPDSRLDSGDRHLDE